MTTANTPKLLPLKTLEQLARQRDPDSRAALLRELTNRYLEADGSASDSARDMFGDVVCDLLEQVALENKAELSRLVAPHASVPQSIVKRLAIDTYEVAAPVLEQSPVLSDTDLIAIARDKVGEYRMSISRRKSVGVRLTASLVQVNEIEVINELAANTGAKFSGTTFRIVAERAKKDAALLNKLAERQDLPSAVKVQISPFLDDAKKASLFSAEEETGLSLFDSLADVVAQEQKKQDSGSPSTGLEETIASIHTTEDLNDCLAEYCDAQDAAGIVAVLAASANLSPKSMRAALHSLDGGPIATICRAIGISADMFDTLSYLRCQWMKVPHADLITQTSTYADLDIESSRKTLRMLVEKQRKNGDVSAAA